MYSRMVGVKCLFSWLHGFVFLEKLKNVLLLVQVAVYMLDSRMFCNFSLIIGSFSFAILVSVFFFWSSFRVHCYNLRLDFNLQLLTVISVQCL